MFTVDIIVSRLFVSIVLTNFFISSNVIKGEVANSWITISHFILFIKLSKKSSLVDESVDSSIGLL